MATEFDEGRVKKERSPSYPFISLRKALWRAETFYEAHRREPTRLSTAAETWGYSPASSGLQQTVGALKQFGLLDDEGSGPDRKLQISELARRITADQRPGVREQGIREAATKPRLIAEYLPKWLPDRPSDKHCESELHFDRGFNPSAAKLFVKVFDDTVSFAGLREDDNVSSEPRGSDVISEEPEDLNEEEQGAGWKPLVPPPVVRNAGAQPLSERLQVVTTGNQLTISAALVNGREVDKLIRILQANKALLDDEGEEEAGREADE